MKRLVFEGTNPVKILVRNIKEENKSPLLVKYELLKSISPKINVPLR